MVRVKVKLLDAGTTREHFGSERECEDWLRGLFPNETENAHRFLACVEAINTEGFAEVEVEPYKEPPERNLLPPNYDTAPQADDPWRREADEGE